ncbi:Outer membrane protein assembly factor BamA [Buchnera aphidicola (Protaphis terricola)]|uniref:outer membrane protein assembly factor BamA n=1 Tax=Buchnera aphidicola TaxID=9 RepID=UPI003464854F
MLIKKFFIIFLMFFSINIYSKSLWTVKNIEFKGLKNCTKQEVLGNILFNIGDKISKNDIQKSIRLLFKTGKFSDIQVFFSTNNSIIFKIKEQPLIFHIDVFGNHIIPKKNFNEYLKKLGMEIGKQYNPYLKYIFIQNIKKLHYHFGRYQSSIRLLTNFSSNNRVNIKILINEGNLLKINHIKIIGNKSFSREKIISLFKLKDYASWWNIFEKRIYYADELERDINNLHNFYLNHGFYYFSIDKKIVNFLKNKNKVNIILKISEGNQYKISNFFINGNFLKYYTQIKNLISISSNEIYNKEKIQLIIQRIKYFLSERGYINTQIEINPEINFIKKTIILNFNININQRYFINQIYFKGNKLTKDIVLRREIKQSEGEWCNLKLLDLSKEALEKIKYIYDIKMIKEFLHDKDNAVNIIYELKERNTGSLNFGLGYGKESGISFNTSISKDNLFGLGNFFKVSAIKNDNQKYIDFQMTYPYFFDNGTNLNSRLFYNNFIYHFNDMSNLIKKTFGFENDLSFLINNANRFNVGVGYTHNSLINQDSTSNNSLIKINKKNLTSNSKEILDDQFLTNSLMNDITLNYSFLHDTLKSLYFPISGNQTYLIGKNTIPGSDNNFYKFLLDTEQYIPLDTEKEFIFSAHFKAGFGDSFNKSKLPFYESFHLNNSNYIRGFGVNTIGPKKKYAINKIQECFGYKKNNFCESIESIGGNAILVANLELIIPIPFIKKDYTQFLRPSFFLDFGNIWDTKLIQEKNQSDIKFIDFNQLKNFHSSVGFALQWFSPIGPLVFSYAHPIQKNENDQIEKFQFSIGKNW